MILQYLDFERPIVDLENRLDQLQRMDDGTDKSVREEAAKLEKKIGKIRKEVFSNLTRWQITQLARHPNRPYMSDYINLIFRNFMEIHGDRAFRDDPSLVCGFAEIEGQPGAADRTPEGAQHQREDPAELRHGEPRRVPQALRVMRLAEKFSLPVITFIDTPAVSRERRGGGGPVRGDRE
jgi:acetyl-CoA carboxylase carboxyl transferase subunit alpha